MAEDESCSKWALNQSSLHRQSSDKKETLLHGETSILESISMGAPLPRVLDKLCTAIDLQIGSIVSVILRADDHELHMITHSALQFGLHVFWAARIPLRSEDVLGSLQMYCCISRSPTPFELQLIERVTHLAALAIQRHNDEGDFEQHYREGRKGKEGMAGKNNSRHRDGPTLRDIELDGTLKRPSGFGDAQASRQFCPSTILRFTTS